MWLTSFYFAGMRLADVLKLRWSDFKDGRLYYAMSKNTKVGSFKISDKVQAILDRYKEDNAKHGFVFPELKELDTLDPYEVQKKIAFAGKNLEQKLKRVAKSLGIDKNISMLLRGIHSHRFHLTKSLCKYCRNCTGIPTLPRQLATNRISLPKTRMMCWMP